MRAVPTVVHPYKLGFGQHRGELLSIAGFQDLIIAAPDYQTLLLHITYAFAQGVATALYEGNVGLCPSCTSSELHN